MTRKVVNYNEDSDSESEEDFEDGLDFDQREDHDESVEGIRRRHSLENQVNATRDLLENSLVPDPTEDEPRNHFTPTRVQFPVNAPQFHPPDNMPNPHQVNFDMEDKEDGDKAAENARHIKIEFDPTNIKFWFVQLEDEMLMANIKRQRLKRPVL